MSALLMIIGVWVLFANIFGDTAKLTGSQVVVRCVFGFALLASGLGIVAWQTYQLLY